MKTSTVMARRKELIENLKQAITSHKWVLCKDSCFRILFGLPATKQLELSCFVIRRYLHIFESRYPAVTWPKEILDDIGDWVHRFFRDIPDKPKELNYADSYLIHSFQAVLLGYCYKENQIIQGYSYHKNKSVLTQSCMVAIINAIAARACNVWEVDAPESVKLLRKTGFPPGPHHYPFNNVAAIAVREREWKEVLAWLISKEIWMDPDDVNMQEMQRSLDEWDESEGVLPVPKEEWDRMMLS